MKNRFLYTVLKVAGLLLLMSIPLFCIACKGASSPAETGTEPAKEVDGTTGHAESDPVDSTADSEPATGNPEETDTSGETDTEEETETKPSRHVYSDLNDNIIITAFHPLSSRDLVTQEQFDLAAAAGIDVMEYCGGMRATAPQLMQRAIEYAAKAGILCNVYDDRIGGNANTMSREELFRIWDEYKDKPGVGGWFLCDESVTPNDYAALINETAAYDRWSTPFINNFPDIWNDGYYADRLADLAHLVYINRENFVLSFDNYPFAGERGTVDENALFKHFEAIRKAGNETGIRTGFYAQVIPYGYRKLEGGELWYHVNVALAYGCTEINYFAWGTPNDELCPGFGDGVMDRQGKPTSVYYDIVEINRYAHTVGSTLVRLDAVEIYHAGRKSNNTAAYHVLPADWFVRTDAYVILSRMEDTETGRNYLMVVNKNMLREQEVTLTFTGVDALFEIDQTSGKETPVSGFDGTLTRKLPAGGAILLCLPEGKSFGTPAEAPAYGELVRNSIILASDSQGSDGWFVNRVADGVDFSEVGSQGWRAKDNDKEWLSFDFGSSKTFDRIDLYPAGNGSASGVYFPTSVTLSVSDDGKTWNEVFTTPLGRPTTDVPVLRFDAVTTRYAKLTFVKDVSSVCELAEIRIYPHGDEVPAPHKTTWEELTIDPTVSVTLGKSVIDYSSNYEHPEWNNSIYHLTDGLYTTNWASDVQPSTMSDDVEYFTVDLQNVYNLDCVVLHPMYDSASGGYTTGGLPGEIRVCVSLDGKSFTTVCKLEGKPTKAEPIVLTFDPVDCRYLRIESTKMERMPAAANCYITQYSEVEAFVHTEPETAARIKLRKILNEAETIDTALYTEESVATFRQALTAAQSVFRDNQASAEGMNKVADALTEAMGALTRRSLGENLALGKPVSATSDYVAPEGIFKASYLTDGENPKHMEVYKTHNGWSVSPYDTIGRDDPVTVTVDLGDVFNVTAVMLQPAYYGPDMFPTAYRIETSPDGNGWQTVASVSGISGATQDSEYIYTVDNVRARYVRIVVTKHSPIVSGSSYISQIGEMEVYGE